MYANVLHNDKNDILIKNILKNITRNKRTATMTMINLWLFVQKMRKKGGREDQKKGCIIMQLYNLIILYMMETNIIYVIMIESWCIEGINWLI